MRTLLAPSVVGALVVTTVLASCSGPGQAGTPPDAESVIPLPAPSLPVRQEIIDMFEGRHSTREFPPEPVLLQEASSLLWAGYGFRRDGGRVVPSAGAIYPMTLYLVAGTSRAWTPASTRTTRLGPSLRCGAAATSGTP